MSCERTLFFSSLLVAAFLSSAFDSTFCAENAEAVEIFAHFLRFKTVSSEDAPGHVCHPEEFQAAHRFLNESFPTVYSSLRIEKVANFSLMFKWEGSEANARPIALLSHQDVVPAEEGPDSPWTKPPFGGLTEGGWVYGRGAIDTKFSLVAILQAAELLLKDGFKPSRTIYFCFGHDEEVGGQQGAANLANLLQERGVELDFLLDEGGNVMTDGIPPLTDRPVAMVSTAEKGFMTVDMSIHAPGGHSSRPPIDKSSVLEVMGRVLTAVSDSPPPLELVQPVPAMLQALAPGATSTFYGYLFKHSQNRAVQAGAPDRQAAAREVGAATAALVRTTAAPTLAHAGLQDNVLPDTGTVVFNFRTLPGEDQLSAEDYLWERVGKDASRVDSAPRNFWTGGEVAPAHGSAWDVISEVITQTFSHKHKGLLIAPNMLSGESNRQPALQFNYQGGLV